MIRQGAPLGERRPRRLLDTLHPGCGAVLVMALHGGLVAGCSPSTPTHANGAGAPAHASAAPRAPERARPSDDGPVVKPQPRPTTPPRCGMPSEPGMAADLGRIELELDGKTRCSGFWRTAGYALRDDDTVDRHVDLLSWRGADGRVRRMPARDDDVLLLDEYPADRPFAVSIAASFRDEAEVIHDVVFDLGGTTRHEWSGRPLTFEVVQGERTYPRTKDPRRRGAFVQVTRRDPAGATRVYSGRSGRVELRAYEPRRQAFAGAVNLELAALDDPEVTLSLKGEFDLRLRD